MNNYLKIRIVVFLLALSTEGAALSFSIGPLAFLVAIVAPAPTCLEWEGESRGICLVAICHLLHTGPLTLTIIEIKDEDFYILGTTLI